MSNKNIHTFISSSPIQTKRIAFSLAKAILKKQAGKTAVVLALQGDLGAGKTCFVQGLAQGLGIEEKITSPSFIIMNRFQVPSAKCQTNPKCQMPKNKQPFQTFYHFDCWRLAGPKEILALGFKEILNQPKNIVVIEWAEKVKKLLPKNTLWFCFKFKDTNKREIMYRAGSSIYKF